MANNSYISRTHNFVNKLGSWLSYVSAALVVYILAHILVEVFLRAAFGRSTHLLEEFVGYALASIIFLAISDVHEKNKLIRVGMIKIFLNKRQDAALETIANVLALLVMLTRIQI